MSLQCKYSSLPTNCMVIKLLTATCLLVVSVTVSALTRAEALEPRFYQGVLK